MQYTLVNIIRHSRSEEYYSCGRSCVYEYIYSFLHASVQNVPSRLMNVINSLNKPYLVVGNSTAPIAKECAYFMS